MCMIFIILKLRVKLNGKVDGRINLTVLFLDHTVDTPLAQHLWMGAAHSTSQKHTFDIILMLT